jgi:hypothetical protein
MCAAAFALALVVPRVQGDGRESSPPSATMEVNVSQSDGSDTAGDGSAERPFATLRRALERRAKEPERRAGIRLGLGSYGGDRGDAFPMRLPDHTRIVGFGSHTCELVGREGQPLFELPADGTVAIESLLLRGASAAIVAAAGDGKSAVELALVDVAIDGCARGIDFAPARGRVALRADGLRVSHARSGLAASGAAELTLSLDDCEFAACDDGVAITSDGAPAAGPWQAVALRECRFDGNAGSGLVRRGSDGRNRAPQPWTIESSCFRGNRCGLSFEIPGGDVPFRIGDCVFTGNDVAGMAIVGSGAALAGTSRVEGCRFRWNGVGAQLLTMGRPLEVERCRFEDSTGIGLNVGNWVGDHSSLRARRCLFAHNGAAGLFGVCEREHGIDVALDRCTVVDNRGGGVASEDEGHGSETWRLTRCIVAGNATDLENVAQTGVKECLVGGDPRFRDRAARDYRLAADSPARTADGVLGALE